VQDEGVVVKGIRETKVAAHNETKVMRFSQNQRQNQ
jgi:hypothetical protein